LYAPKLDVSNRDLSDFACKLKAPAGVSPCDCDVKR